MGQPTLPPKPRVLLVEDHQDSREMMQQLLEHAGMTVKAVTSAEEALAVALTETLTIVLTDVSLGGGVRDGVWLLNRLRLTSPHLPVIAVTGRRERVDELLEMGFAAVSVKPSEVDSLLAIIRDAISR
jgi:DNA-binding response OmpR family regulator